MNANWRCAIWDTPAVGDGNTGRDGTLVDSPRAGGRYFVSGTAVAILEHVDDRQKARLTTWLVEQRRLGNDCPEITTATIKEAETRPDLGVPERADRVLKYLETKVPHVGASVEFQVFRGMYQEVNPEPAEVIYLELLASSECVISGELMYDPPPHAWVKSSDIQSELHRCIRPPVWERVDSQGPDQFRARQPRECYDLEGPSATQACGVPVSPVCHINSIRATR